jgi:NitT/TauT family transport system substrate-binding protein
MKVFTWVLLVALVVGCEKRDAAGPTTQHSDGEKKVTLQLNWKPEPQFGGFYAAKDSGAFTKHGVDVDVVAGGVGTPTVQMVAAGKVAFGVVSADELILARANGADVVALFAVYQTCPQGLMTHASRGFKEIGDIFRNPGTVAMQKGLPYASWLEKKFGFDKVKVVPSPGGDLSVFRNEKDYAMQCFVTSEPIAAKKLGLDAQTFLVAEAGYNPYTTVLVTRGDYLKNNQETVKSVVQAVGEGWKGYLENPAPTNETMQKLNPTMDAQTFSESAAAQKPLIETAETKTNGLGSMTKERWETLGKQLVELKVVDKAAPADACFVDLKKQ